MKVDFNMLFVDHRGRPQLVQDEPETKNEAGDVVMMPKVHQITLADVAAEALLAPTQGDNAVQKLTCYELAMRCFKGGEVELTDAEVKLLKDKIGAVYYPAIVGPAYAMLGG